MPRGLQRVWSAVAPHTRVVLLTADSDWGVPCELWGGGRAGHGCGLPPLRELLADARLHGWWTQNYDLHTAPLPGGGTEEAALLRKLRALPIGIDLHTYAPRAEGGKANGGAPRTAQAQSAELAAAAAAMPPFAQRAPRAMAAGWRLDAGGERARAVAGLHSHRAGATSLLRLLIVVPAAPPQLSQLSPEDRQVSTDVKTFYCSNFT